MKIVQKRKITLLLSSRFLAEPPVIKDKQERNKQKFTNMYIHERDPGETE